MFLKKIGKKIIFAIRRKKAFFLDFYSQALLRLDKFYGFRSKSVKSPAITAEVCLIYVVTVKLSCSNFDAKFLDREFDEFGKFGHGTGLTE